MASFILMMNYKRCVRWHHNFRRLRKDMHLGKSFGIVNGREYNCLISKRKNLYVVEPQRQALQSNNP